jgi:hypothetical protein
VMIQTKKRASSGESVGELSLADSTLLRFMYLLFEAVGMWATLLLSTCP